MLNDLFTQALGVERPWQVKDVRFSTESSCLDIWLEFPRGTSWTCPVCGRDCGAAHDSRERSWRHLNFFQHECHLHARVPRVHCPEHGTRTVPVPWARPGLGFTLLMDAFVLSLVQAGMTVNQVAKMLNVHDTRIWRMLDYYVDKARQEADYSEVETIGIDETSRARGHDYISVFMDLNHENRRVLYVTPGRDAGAVDRFVRDLEDHNAEAEQIKQVCIDMSPAYISGIDTYLPEAQVTFDQFHLMKMLNEAVDQVRREEQQSHPELKNTRYVWLKNPWNHTRTQGKAFDLLRAKRMKTTRAYHLKLSFQDLFLAENAANAEALLRGWYDWAIRCRLKPIVEFARTLKRHWQGVLNWFTSQISNGVLEGINSLIQAMKAKARGFRSFRNFETIIYLNLAKLDLSPEAILKATH